MNQKINITIPKPCHENWQAMTPTEKGRFCGSCQKNVFDFTFASDRQIVEAYKKDSNLCGRFLTAQLNRDLVEPKEKSAVWLATASAIISFLSLGNHEITAQEKPKTEQTDKKIVPSGNLNDITSNQGKEITGIVSDRSGPLPGVNVFIKGTGIGIQTDFDGKFSIKAKEGETLVFSFLGMKDVSVIIGASKIITVEMADDNPMMGEVVVIKKRNIFSRSLHKIGNLFR